MATATKAAAAKAAPAKPTAPAVVKPKAPATPEEAEAIFGVSDIAELIKVDTGKEVKTRDLRTLLRKMARDGRLDREIIAGNRERWVWEGPNDPEVDTILEAYKNGELDADKKEKLDALKARKAEQREAKKAEEAALAEAAGDEEALDEE